MANLKITSDNNGFQKAMKENTEALKNLQGSFRVANTEAKNFGNEQEQLKTKEKELKGTLDILNKTLELQGNQSKKLKNDLIQLKNENVDLQQRIDKVSKAYKESVTATGKNSEESKKLKEELTKLKDEYKQNNSAIDSTEKKLSTLENKFNGTKVKVLDTKKALEDTSKSIDNFKAEQLSKKLDKISNGFSKVGDFLTTRVTAPMTVLFGVATKGTEEFRGDMSKFEANVKSAGANMDVASNSLKYFNAISGETDSSIEAMSNLLSSGFSDNQMQQAVENLSGAVIKFPDTLKIESLADSMQETLATGQATGQYGELLERLGINLDTFNAGLVKAKKNGTEQQYVLDILTKNGLADLNAKYKENNEDLIKNSENQYELQKSLADLGTTLTPFLNTFTGALNSILNVFNNLDKGTQENIVKFGLFATALGPVSKGISGTINIVNKCKTGYDKLREGIDKIPNVASKAGKGIKTFAGHIGNGAKAVGTFTLNLAKNTLELVKNAAKAAIAGTKTALLTVKTKLQTIAQGALNFVMSLNPATLIIIGIVALIAAIVILWKKCEWFRDLISDAWDWIKEKFNAFDEWLTGIFTTDWTESFGAFGNILNAFFDTVGEIWESIKKIFSGIIDFVAGIFTGDWERCWDGVCSIFGGIFGGLKAIAKAPINAVIGLLNFLIDCINSISFDVPEWVPVIGGSTFGFSISHIGYLEDGGILTEPTMLNSNYMAGERMKGSRPQEEAVIPLDKMYKEVEHRMQLVLENNRQTIVINAVIENVMDGKKVGKIVAPIVIDNMGKQNKLKNIGKGAIV